MLDEATSSIDTETEALIQHGIHVLMEGKTSLVIAHRLSTIQDVDRIFVMHHGRVAESGSHTRAARARRALRAAVSTAVRGLGSAGRRRRAQSQLLGGLRGPSRGC